MPDKAESYEHRPGGNLKNSPGSPGPPRQVPHSSPITTVIAASVLTIVLLMGLGWQIWQSYLDHEETQKQAFPIQALKDQIIHFDEVLTMSANMAAATGDPPWEERYRQFEPRLDVAIRTLKRLLPGTFDSAATIQTDEANVKLVEMENQVFELVGRKRLDEAQAILSSDDYREQKKLYSDGMERIAADLKGRVAADLESHRKSALIAVVSVLLGLPLLALIWLWVLQNMRRCLMERNQVERALKESEERYRGFMEASPDATAIVNEDGQIVMVNSQMEKMFGYSRQELLGKVVETLMPERFRDIHLKHRTRFSADPVPRPVGTGREQFALCKDGTELPVDISLGPLHTEEGLLVVTCIRDMTEHKQAEKELRDSEERFRIVSDLTYDVLWERDIAGGIHTWFGDIDKELGFGKNEFPRTIDAWKKVIHPEDYDRVMKTLDKHLEEHVPWHEEYRVITKDGNIKYWDDRGETRWGKNGKALIMTGAILDITERRQVEESLEKEKYRLIKAQEIGKIGFWELDLIENVLIWTKENHNIFGISDEINLTYETFLNCVHPDDREYVNAEWLAGIDGKPYDIEHRIIANGKVKWVREKAELSFDNIGKAIRAAGVTQDITERKRTTDALLQSEKRYRMLFEQSADATLIIEGDKFIDCNEATVKMLGYTNKRELLHTHPSHLSPEFQPDGKSSFEKANEMMSIAFERGSHRFEWAHKRCNGEVFPVEVLLTDVALADRNFLHVVWRDITVRKRIEEERELLLKTLIAKNEELQSIVYVASHDLKSPLVNIQGFSGELAAACERIEAVLHSAKTPAKIQRELTTVLDEDIPQSLSFIRAGTLKIQALLEGLLEISRVGTAAFEIEAIDTNEMMALIITGMQFEITKCGADVTIDDLPGCMGDTRHINQVFSNLLNNAVKYLNPDRKGVIHVSGQVQGEESIFCVADNGLGIAPAHQPKIFELFHRLEPTGDVKGEGLGLTIVLRILNREGGKIWVESEPGKGSRFFVSLPRA